LESPNNLTWDNSIEVPDNIDEFLDDFFKVDNSTVELVDLSQNTLQILDDFTGNWQGTLLPPITHFKQLKWNRVRILLKK
jgi:hypothetical protein